MRCRKLAPVQLISIIDAIADFADLAHPDRPAYG
jgi:hypothetical protein